MWLLSGGLHIPHLDEQRPDLDVVSSFRQFDLGNG